MKKYISGLIFLILILIACASVNSPQESINVKSILALGDSYTIGESVAESERWPEQLKAGLENELNKSIQLKTIAKTGWRTDELRGAVNEEGLDKTFDLVTLLIGVNNQYQGKPFMEYPTEFRLCLEQAISYAPSVKGVIVVSIPDYGFTPFGQKKDPDKISEEIDKYNDINRSISKEYGVKYVNITDITRNGLIDPQLVAEDGLHPSGSCYSQFIPRILNALKGY